MDAVSSRSSLTMEFSSTLFIKQDCSFDSVSESYQLLSAVLKFKGMIVRDGHTRRKSYRCRHEGFDFVLDTDQKIAGSWYEISSKFPRILLRMVREERLQPL